MVEGEGVGGRDIWMGRLFFVNSLYFGLVGEGGFCSENKQTRKHDRKQKKYWLDISALMKHTKLKLLQFCDTIENCTCHAKTKQN